MICVQPSRNRKETLVPKSTTDEMIEVLSVVGDITNVMTIDAERFVEVTTSSSSSDTMSPDSSEVRPRKRAKLDHLSSDEKAQHRKMMNRISAQSARDRQKAQMQLQEVQIKNLMTTNGALKKENESLSNKCNSLTSENQRMSDLVKEYEAKIKLLESFSGEIKTQIKIEPMEDTPSECGNGRSNDVNSSLEPAVPRTVPQPKGPELAKDFSFLLLLWTCFQWILTNPNLSKHSMNSLSKSLVQEICSQVDSKQPSLQTRAALQMRLMQTLKSVRLKEAG
ncbi:cyclic AMP-dependent transcription factor ATF-6 alpha [Folsomia candida]|uniref:cyclic AMP-dependent transcription factor ATF-6 alpha n=1 Tax=Folsomia candida TaxID=158441 RepID=UPI000B90678E|nr:cyclic AMP-dependent transcription factor ATF-6 alpha [Folsomia candida]